MANVLGRDGACRLIEAADAVDPNARSPAAELEALAEGWLAMARATTLEEMETAAISGLLGLIDVRFGYVTRREHGIWVIGSAVGFSMDLASVSIPEGIGRRSSAIAAGESIRYQSREEMGPALAHALAAIGLGSLFCVPIMRDGLCIGALAIGRAEASVFRAREQALAQLFTLHLSALLGNRELVASLETLAESVPAIVLRTDRTGWIDWYNHRWYEYTGQSREEAKGWGWQTALHATDLQRVMEDWPRALQTGLPLELEFRMRRFDGVYEWHLSRMEPVRDETGSVISWYGNITNIDAQKQKLERTKRVADSLQDAFLPQRLPTRSYLRLDASYVSAEADALVGGDWYDAFDLPDGRLGFSIGDVAGHGLPASMAVGKLRQSIFTLALRSDDPAHILGEVNRVLCFQEPGVFVTAIVGFIDREGTKLWYASAGHPPPIVSSRDEEPATLLPTGGLPLGVSDTLRLSNHTVPVVKDSVFVLYTDGMTESGRDPVAGELQLRAAISTLARNTAESQLARTLYERVLGDVAPADDAALMVIAFSPASVSPPSEVEHGYKKWRFHAADARAAHVARGEVGAFIVRLAGGAHETYESELIVGELLANTVEHAPGLVDVEIEWTGEHPVITVRDSGPGLKALRKTLPTDPLDEGSRGLFLVNALSPSVTLTQSPGGGAELRVTLPVRRPEELTGGSAGRDGTRPS